MPAVKLDGMNDGPVESVALGITKLQFAVNNLLPTNSVTMFEIPRPT